MGTSHAVALFVTCVMLFVLVWSIVRPQGRR